MSSGPLSNIVVVERAGRLAASVAATLLAELGATVWRFSDQVGRPPSDPVAWHKHPLSLEGKRIAPFANPLEREAQWAELAAHADVVIHSDSAGSTLAALPCASAQLTCVFGALGRGDDALLDEMQLQAMSGLCAVTGDADKPPRIISVPVLEMVAGINGATSVLAALRTAGWRGQTLDLAVFDTAVALLGTFHSAALTWPERRFRDGCRHPLLSPWNIYRTADGWISLCSTTNQHWQRLLGVIERTDLAEDPRFTDTNVRAAHATEVDAVVGAWMQQQSTALALEAIGKIGVPAGAVATIPQMIARQAQSGYVRDDAMQDGKPVLRPSVLADLKDMAPASTQGKPVAAVGKPCAGLRVVEIGPYTAGPLTGRLLADLGAQVIKVEPQGGEISRKWLPSFEGISGYFANYNAGKDFLFLDFSQPEGARQLWQLLGEADVLIQNLGPGAMERAGFGRAAVLARFPDLIYCSISGYGASAPPLPAVDTVIQAASGIMTQVRAGTADEELPYMKVGISIADLVAAHVATLSILAALGLEQTHGGGHLDAPMIKALAWLTQLAWPQGEAHDVPAVTIACSDGYVVAHSVTAFDASVFAGLDRDAVCASLRDNGMVCAPVRELQEVLGSALTKKRNLVQCSTYRDREIPILSSPHRWSSEVPSVRRRIGEAGDPLPWAGQDAAPGAAGSAT